MKHLFLSLSLVAILPLGLSACQSETVSETVTCALKDVRVDCLLERAQTVLDSVEDDFTWASSAAELAIAYGVSGKPEQSRALINIAIEKTADITDAKKREAAYLEILSAIAELPKDEMALDWVQKIASATATLEGRTKAEIMGKSIVINAVHNDIDGSLIQAKNLPHDTDVEGYAKVITLRKIANIAAKAGELETAYKAVESITMSLDYYKSMARSDVARLAYKAGDKDSAERLLEEADPIARSLGNGYFVGAALRDIGYSYQTFGDVDKAKTYFDQALEATATAEKQNEKARATSRVATRLSDAGLSSQTTDVLHKAANFAKDIETDIMKSYSYYEIAGAAGLSGQFDLSRGWIDNVPDTPMGSTSSIKGAAKRDLAWGLTRYGQAENALDVIDDIEAKREKIHALSRMIRLLQNPKMEALPRYL